MFADLDETIRQLLIRDVPIDQTEIDISFDTPDRDWSGRLTKPAVNCFLYDVRENLKLRSVAWEVKRNGETGTATRSRAPIRIDASYQVTAWARAPEDEHRLLWRVLQALVHNSPMPKDLLQGDLVNHPAAIPTWVGQPEQMPGNFADLWQGLENRLRPSLTYVVSLLLDPEISVTSPIVLSQPGVGIRQITPDQAGVMPIKGRVTNRDADGQGIAGAVVVLRETDERVTTDEEGNFAMNAAPRGNVTLIVRAKDKPEIRAQFHVPAPNYDIDI